MSRVRLWWWRHSGFAAGERREQSEVETEVLGGELMHMIWQMQVCTCKLHVRMFTERNELYQLLIAYGAMHNRQTGVCMLTSLAAIAQTFAHH